MKCPHCHKVTAQESKRCVHCGKNVHDIFLLDNHTLPSKNCPVCRIPTSVITLANIELDYCYRCSGVWFDKREMEKFETHLTTEDNTNEVVTIVDKLAPDKKIQSANRGTYIKCPICNEFMIHKNYHEISGVILDQCVEHGIWAEKNDLVKILNFILSGDIQQLIEKSLERKHEELNNKIRLLESEQAGMKFNITRNTYRFSAHLILDFLGFL